jgi:hypothetical protein
MSAPLDRCGVEKSLGGTMGRHLAFGGAARPLGRSVSSLACLVFVVLLGLAFWAAALWLGQIVLRTNAAGF